MAGTPRDRLRENATGLATTIVTGVWLTAMFAGFDWWLAAMLFGYVVVIPVVALLFGDEDDVDEWWDDQTDHLWTDETGESDDSAESNRRDALETLRDRYARGELTDEQFERKVERLLDTESLEDLEDRERERTRE